MNLVDLSPFDPDHVLKIHLRDDEATSPQYRTMMHEWAKFCHASGPSFTAVEGDLILCCVGLKVIKEGVAEAWMVLSKEGTDRKYLRAMYFQVSTHMKELMRDLNLHRVQAWVREDFHAGARYAEVLGFKKEGVMRKYDIDKTDCFLYSFVEGD